MKTCNICSEKNPCPECIQDHANRKKHAEFEIFEKETKTIFLHVWEQNYLYPHDEWECYGYSEFDSLGIPKFAEIRRIYS